MKRKLSKLNKAIKKTTMKNIVKNTMKKITIRTIENALKIAVTYLYMLLLSMAVLTATTTIAIAATTIDPPPLTMLKNTSDQLIVELNKHLGELKNNDPLVRNLVKRIVVPHIDTTGMSQAVIGRLYWQPATPQLQQQFIAQFSTYVIRTYAAAFASYDGETITFNPIRGYTTDQTRVQISSIIHRKDGPAIQVQYRVVNKNNAWLIYDFSVDGVSLVENYRAQFAEPLQQGGLSLLVKKLVEKNVGRQ